jgi:hypothetical protein
VARPRKDGVTYTHKDGVNLDVLELVAADGDDDDHHHNLKHITNVLRQPVLGSIPRTGSPEMGKLTRDLAR